MDCSLAAYLLVLGEGVTGIIKWLFKVRSLSRKSVQQTYRLVEFGLSAIA
jgi:hypothetical protein